MKFLRNDPTLKEQRRDLRRNQTDTERIFWSHLRNRQFCGMKFFRQYSIGPYILDFYSPAMKLAVELDGGQHNQTENKNYDAARSRYLKTQGIDIIRFWNHEVLLDIEGVLGELMLKITPPNLPFNKLFVSLKLGGWTQGEECRIDRSCESAATSLTTKFVIESGPPLNPSRPYRVGPCRCAFANGSTGKAPMASRRR